jgi:phosphoserine phosphatase RsbU/P
MSTHPSRIRQAEPTVAVPGWARAVRQLLDEVHHTRPEDLPGLMMRLAPTLDSVELVLYLVDYGQVTLMPLNSAGAAEREPQLIEATLPGRTFATGQPLTATTENGHRLWLPLINGTERLGVVELVTATAVPPQWDDLLAVAALLAETITSRRLYGDAFERIRRRLPMQMAAEIIWNQLPPLTYATDVAAVSAILEPCYEVGGDAFDYAVNGDVLHVGLFDAVGHGIGASSLTSLAISAYRNARRCGLDLSDTYRSMDKWISAQYPDSFVTAVLAELDTSTGGYRSIAAGHPGGLLLRDGKLVMELPSPTAFPLGWGNLGDPIPAISEESLQPGDKVLLYTDGVVEARTEHGEFFGTGRLVDFVTRALADRLPTPETMRRLTHAILAHQHDRLQDDATAAMIEWRPEYTYGELPR